MSLSRKIKVLEEFIKNQKKTINNLNKEKLELEEIIMKQEDRVSELSNKFNLIDKMMKDKNRELKENEQSIMQLVNIIEEQKKTINNMSTGMNKRNSHYRGSSNPASRKIVQNIKENNKLNKDSLKNNIQVDKNFLPPIKSGTPNINDYSSPRKESEGNLEEITNMMKRIIDEN
jgi:predicted RNase H-like nuclease (RuvC/YqgF family)